ncbi:MAG: DUF6252 family protein [Gemmatimonadaceae bacterium]
MRRLSAILPGMLLVATSCGGSSIGGATDPTTSALLNGTFGAAINGAAWSAAGRVAVTRSVSNSLIIVGASLTYSLSFTLFNAAGPGTYSLVYTTTTLPSFAILASAGAAWTTSTTGGTGTVVLTTLTSSRVAGTFTFDAPPSPGQGTTTAHVTGGAFDVTY